MDRHTLSCLGPKGIRPTGAHSFGGSTSFGFLMVHQFVDRAAVGEGAVQSLQCRILLASRCEQLRVPRSVERLARVEGRELHLVHIVEEGPVVPVSYRHVEPFRNAAGMVV